MRTFRGSRRTLIFALITVAIFLHLLSSNVLTITTSQSTKPSTKSTVTTPVQLDNSNHPGRIFIASNHWNSAHILPSWIASIRTLIQLLGPQNVFFSTTANGSFDRTGDILRELDAELERLGVARRIVVGPETHADLIAEGGDGSRDPGEGWIFTPRGKFERRRIPYLAGLRNSVLEPLDEITEFQRFDKILFLNDVIFTAEDAIALLLTNNSTYAAACALDFSKPTQLYDTFATRDTNGYPPALPHYPYFYPGPSRDALLHPEISNNIVPVKSCWNGMIAFDAAPFQPGVPVDPKELKGLDAREVLAKMDPEPLIRFRGIQDSLATRHVEGSECCLIHADNPLTKKKGVFINANVKVAYNKPAWDAIGTEREIVGFKDWIWTIVTGLVGGGWGQGKVRERVREWVVEGEELREDRVEDGTFCLVDEMQVLIPNGWKHL